jgi:hypothetical protein
VSLGEARQPAREALWGHRDPALAGAGGGCQLPISTVGAMDVFTVIVPCDVHMHWSLSMSAARPPTVTVAEPGVQGLVVFGMHGAGVWTPRAAAVAAMTAGSLGELHIPNVGMFVIGLKSMTVQAIWFIAWTIPGVAVSGTGVGTSAIEQLIIVVPLHIFAMTARRLRADAATQGTRRAPS